MPLTEAQDATLRQLAGEMHLAEAARNMQLSRRIVWDHAYHNKIRALPLKTSKEPTYGEFAGAIIAEAHEARIKPSLVLSGSRLRKAVRARWRAYRRILKDNPQYSIAGVARVANLDHTSILYALKRLNELEAE